MHRFVSNPSTRSHRSSLSSPLSPSEGKLQGRNHAVPAWCNLIRKDGKSAARIGASNVNTCRLDIFVTSKDSDRNRGNRRYARETPPPWIADISRICKRILAIHIYRICGTPPFVCFKLPPPPPTLSALVIFPRCPAGVKNAEKESFVVQAKTSVTRKNICVLIYQLERKIEIFRDAGAASKRGEIVMTEIRVSN